MGLRPQHEPPDADASALLQRAQQQLVGLLRSTRRHHVVGLLEIDRVDVLETDELLEVDHAARRRSDPLDLLRLEEDVRLRFDLVAPDEILVRHLHFGGTLVVIVRLRRLGDHVVLLGLPERRTGLDDPPVSDAAPLSVEEMEPDVLRFRRGIERDGDRHEPEAQGPSPDRTRHGTNRSREHSARTPAPVGDDQWPKRSESTAPAPWRSSAAIRSMSSGLSSKSNTSMFSASRSGFEVLGIGTSPS